MLNLKGRNPQLFSLEKVLNNGWPILKAMSDTLQTTTPFPILHLKKHNGIIISDFSIQSNCQLINEVLSPRLHE